MEKHHQADPLKKSGESLLSLLVINVLVDSQVSQQGLFYQVLLLSSRFISIR